MMNRSDYRWGGRRPALARELPNDVFLRRKVVGGFVAAVALTVFLGFLSWYDARRAEQDADWVTHTQVVLKALDATAVDLVDVDTGGCGFALSGFEPFLKSYESGRRGLGPNLDRLRHLTADNLSQQQRLDRLEPQAKAKADASDGLVSARSQTGLVPTVDQLVQGALLMHAAHGTIQAMADEEERLLDMRVQRTHAARRWTISVMILGSLLAMSFLIGAGIAINRQISISVRARAQIVALNGDLERRVEQRTAALQSEITQRIQAKERLAEQAAELARQAEELSHSRQEMENQTLMFQSVLDSMAEGLVAADQQGKFILWNPAAERILGVAANLSPDEWTQHYGLYMADGVTPFPSDQIPLVRAIRKETSVTEMFVRNPESAIGTFIEVSAGPLVRKDGVVCGGVAAFRDITQRKADERQIQKLNDELEHRVAERTAELEVANHELEAFSYSVSHDLRAPLRHISGFSRMLAEEFGPTLDPNAQQYLERIQFGAQKMGLLVDELLNLARVGRHPLHRQPTRLNRIVADVVAMLQPDYEGRQVEWSIADLPIVDCDPVLVKQIFQNLLANALKFTGPRGGAAAKAGAGTPSTAARALIEVSFTEENGQTVFMVRDNGIGFNMKYVDKLFGVFQRLHSAEEFEGTGIGLVTVQRIVHKHGGRVWAQGAPNQGAAFYFTLGVAGQSESKVMEAGAGGQS
jgi:PAS domain S-box-containing protein